MLKLIDGPKRYLNDSADGPFAFNEEADLYAYNATEWLYNYALNAVEDHGVSWSDFDNAIGIMTTYAVRYEDENGRISEEYLTQDRITKRGIEILNAATRGEDPEELFDEWREYLYDKANKPA